ncbi:hypothetical protein [Rhizobium phaseoli]|uniref:hypothetical protein n=1 Tax=Rhizobium phaseoli TaxID=396 RepID=UPI00130D5D83|nr:hypothetical protein [Rhizobium phaseoli]
METMPLDAVARHVFGAQEKRADLAHHALRKSNDDFRGRCVGQLNLIKVVEKLAILI